MDGSSNAYLRENRAIEEFLKTIEPRYNSSVEKLATAKLDSECIYVIAGFVAYVVTCSPAGMRVQSEPFKSALETTATTADAHGLLPPPPELGSQSLTELLRSGSIQIKIDPKYPQAVGISSILNFTTLFGNFKWEILRNDSKDSPFFTSDFPVAIEKTDDPRVLNRIVPLTPNLMLRIKPDITIDRNRLDFSFANLTYRSRKISRDEIKRLNCLIVRCAEETVFYRDDLPWVRAFVAKNRHYRIEPHTRRVKTPSGTLLIFTQRIVASA